MRGIEDRDREWLRAFIVERWGAETVATRGQLVKPHEFPGFIAAVGEKVVGVITYRHEGDDSEVTSIDSPAAGVGACGGAPGRDRQGTRDTEAGELIGRQPRDTDSGRDRNWSYGC